MFSCPTHASVGQPNGGAEDLKEATWMQKEATGQANSWIARYTFQESDSVCIVSGSFGRSFWNFEDDFHKHDISSQVEMLPLFVHWELAGRV